jgi:hypothetical protein
MISSGRFLGGGSAPPRSELYTTTGVLVKDKDGNEYVTARAAPRPRTSGPGRPIPRGSSTTITARDPSAVVRECPAHPTGWGLGSGGLFHNNLFRPRCLLAATPTCVTREGRSKCNRCTDKRKACHPVPPEFVVRLNKLLVLSDRVKAAIAADPTSARAANLESHFRQARLRGHFLLRTTLRPIKPSPFPPD